jgi:hypothetical protein
MNYCSPSTIVIGLIRNRSELLKTAASTSIKTIRPYKIADYMDLTKLDENSEILSIGAWRFCQLSFFISFTPCSSGSISRITLLVPDEIFMLSIKNSF